MLSSKVESCWKFEVKAKKATYHEVYKDVKPSDGRLSWGKIWKINQARVESIF